MSFLVDSLGFSAWMIMISTNKTGFISSFQSASLVFPFLTALTQTYSMMSKRSSERGHSCPLPDFTGKALTFLPSSMMLATGLFLCGYSLSGEEVILYSQCSERFYHEWVLIILFSNAFFASVDIIMCFLFHFQAINVMDFIN